MPVAQPELDFRPPPPVNHGRLEAAFAEFHRMNPKVYAKFCEYCAQLLTAGFKSYSADAICHAIRFDHDIAIQSVDVDAEGHALKLNNNHVRFYAELWAREHGNTDFFHSRKQTHA